MAGPADLRHIPWQGLVTVIAGWPRTVKLWLLNIGYRAAVLRVMRIRAWLVATGRGGPGIGSVGGWHRVAEDRPAAPVVGRIFDGKRIGIPAVCIPPYGLRLFPAPRSRCQQDIPGRRMAG